MIDITKHKNDISCPNCGRNHGVSLGDFSRNRSITCSCGQLMTFNDDKGDVRKINDAFKKLEQTFKKIGR